MFRITIENKDDIQLVVLYLKCLVRKADISINNIFCVYPSKDMRKVLFAAKRSKSIENSSIYEAIAYLEKLDEILQE